MGPPSLSEFLVPFACLMGDEARNTCWEDIVRGIATPPPTRPLQGGNLGELPCLQKHVEECFSCCSQTFRTFQWWVVCDVVWVLRKQIWTPMTASANQLRRAGLSAA